jgi:NitT/TauT family transport system ATP-binding protein
VSGITVQNLSMSYDAVPVLERISLEVAFGSFCTIVGASGCGKSTFLRLLLGQERPSGGTILLDGEPLPPEPTPDRGIVFQRYSIFPHLTVLENLMLAADFKGSPVLARVFGGARRAAEAEARTLLDRVGLAAAAERYPAQLSGGMQQRVAIAQALTMRPRVLLLDEPFGALDPGVRADMQDLLLDVWREHGMTVFMVTHDLPEAFKLGTRLLAFDKVRVDPQFPNAYGATITYDLPIDLADPADPSLPTEVAAQGAEPAC